MVSEMLSHIHFITPIEKSDPGLTWQSPASFSYIFKATSGKDSNKDFQFFFSNRNNQPFSLTFEQDSLSDFDDSWFEKVCLILSHPRYLKVDNRRIICIHKIVPSLVKSLEDELAQQGFYDVLCVETDPSQLHSFILFDGGISNEENFYNWYEEAVSNSTSPLNILAFFEDKESAIRLLNWQKNAETRFHSSHPRSYRLVRHLHERSEELNSHKALIDELQKDLSSKKAYLDYILGKSKLENGDNDVDVNALMKIKKFYYNEYEILPVWYKRFGHILKVIMGKRTFRSLFDDNVKKYKD